MKINIIIVGLAVSMVLVSHGLLAQLPGLPGPPDQAPIDGGLALLAALGGAYAIKKLRGRAGKP